jgi:anti-sigma factor RsiW
MDDRLRHHDTFHCSDEQLLLHVDRELSLLESARVRMHLAACPVCRERAAQIESTFARFTHLQDQSNKPIMNDAGPRALLRARLSEAASNTRNLPRMGLRFAYGLGFVCVLALLMRNGSAIIRRGVIARLSGYSLQLPDPSYTPGATREVALAELCSTEREEVVRNVPGPLQHRVLQEYGIRETRANEFEVDYLITPGLGGADDLSNLWPQPRFNTTWNSFVKDQLEDHLHHMVCERKISLREAQQDIASNWIAAYKKYFSTEQPLANRLQAELSGTDHLLFALRRKQRSS